MLLGQIAEKISRGFLHVYMTPNLSLFIFALNTKCTQASPIILMNIQCPRIFDEGHLFQFMLT